ncbi:DNA polymerase III subunit psi [Pasteurellaceae bacterium RH1A]|nr:DNA polymerase III subunit psi [Pasteurellaceae bacterium RH1A]
MNRRDLLLHEMKITQWELVKPQVLKGDAQIRLSPEVKLVVVCEEDGQKSPLFQDILHCLGLKPHQYQWLNLEQSLRLHISHQPLFWLLQKEEQAGQFVKKFANQPACIRQNQWQDLQHPQDKRRFWQALQPFLGLFTDD